MSEHEMYRTFNMGIGFTLVVDPKNAALTLAVLRRHKVEPFVIGRVVKGSVGAGYKPART